jgi:hypothetical protein
VALMLKVLVPVHYARGQHPFHYRGLHCLFVSLSNAVEKINNVVDSKRNCISLI